MAPRRLIALMIGLLLFSSVITALLPTDKPDSIDTTMPSTGQEMPTPPLPKDGQLRNETIRLGSDNRPVLKLRVGDQLALRVSGSRPATISLQGLGATSDLAPGTPARFNVLLLDPGSYPVTELASGRRVGEIKVRPRERSSGSEGGSKRPNHGPPPQAPETT